MDFTVDRKGFAQNLALLAKVARKSNSVPVLNYVRIATDWHEVHLSTTDLELWAFACIEASVASAGEVLVPVEPLTGLPNGSETIRIHQPAPQREVLVEGSGTFQLPYMDPAEFPMAPALKPASLCNIENGKELVALVKRTSFASDTGAPDYLSGTKVEINDGVVKLLATDGRRLAIATSPSNTAFGSLDVVVPTRLLELVDRLQGSITVAAVKPDPNLDQEYVRFSDGWRTIAAKCEGPKTLPRYEKVIPRNPTHTVEVNRVAFRDAVKAMLKVADKRSRLLKLTFAGAALEIVASTSEGGGKLAIPLVGWTVEPLSVGFNGSYLLDFLKAASGAFVTVALTDEKSAALFSDTDRYLYVVMPMKLP